MGASQHPHIHQTRLPAPNQQVHVTSSHIYFAMEYASGGTLDQLLQAKASKPKGAFGSFVGSRGMPLPMASYLVVSGQCAGHAAALRCSLVQPTAPRARMQEGQQLGEPEALRIFLQIFQALDYCHRRCVGGCRLGAVGAGALWRLPACCNARTTLALLLTPWRLLLRCRS